MAYIVLTSNQSNLCKVVFKNMTIKTAMIIANRMNGLAKLYEKNHVGSIQLTYKVIGE